MKPIHLCIFILFNASFLFSQTKESPNFTPAQIQKIQASVNKKAEAFRLKLSNDPFLSGGAKEFALDTFKAEETARQKMEIAQSSVAMNEVTFSLSADYDKLLNKYYNRLLKLLQPEDQKILIQAQREWLAFQAAERNLIAILTNPAYSGGGSIVSNIYSAQLAQLTINRALTIGEYYLGVEGNQEGD